MCHGPGAWDCLQHVPITCCPKAWKVTQKVTDTSPSSGTSRAIATQIFVKRTSASCPRSQPQHDTLWWGYPCCWKCHLSCMTQTPSVATNNTLPLFVTRRVLHWLTSNPSNNILSTYNHKKILILGPDWFCSTAESSWELPHTSKLWISLCSYLPAPIRHFSKTLEAPWDYWE